MCLMRLLGMLVVAAHWCRQSLGGGVRESANVALPEALLSFQL